MALRRFRKHGLLVIVGVALIAGPALAQQGDGTSPTPLPGPSSNGPVTIDDPLWTEIAVIGGVGTPATGCSPADPAGPGCTPSSAGNSQFGDAPPWTFTSATSVVLTVTDCFDIGDGLEVFDNAVSIGVTSVPVGSGSSGDDPVGCLADPNMSSGTFTLGPGSHSITMVMAYGDTGAMYFRVDSGAPAPTLPQWAMIVMTLLLLAAGSTMLWRRSKSTAL